jgi:hypothetical protein
MAKNDNVASLPAMPVYAALFDSWNVVLAMSPSGAYIPLQDAKLLKGIAIEPHWSKQPTPV